MILPSSPIDGDSLGSALALYLTLKKLGIQATVVTAEENISETYNFLPQISAITHEMDFLRDMVVTVDFRGSAAPDVKHEIQNNKLNIIITPKEGGISRDDISFSRGPVPYDCVVVVDTADISSSENCRKILRN